MTNLKHLASALTWLVATSPLVVSQAFADALVVTRAMKASTIVEFFIDDDALRAELAIGVADLYAFRNVLPDNLYERLAEKPRPYVERQREFFRQDFVLRADGGEPLIGKVEKIVPRKRVARDEITGEPLAKQPDDVEPVVYVELTWPLVSRPLVLSIQPPLRPDRSAVAANIGFVTYHGGLPVNDFRYLSTKETLDLDWDDPWYSRFRNKNLKRKFDAPLSVFLYVEHFEVRKEVIIRPKDMQQWKDLGLTDRKIIRAEEQVDLKKKVTDFLIDRGRVLIDDKPVPPVLDRVHFIRRSLRKTGVIEPPEDLDINSATLGVIFVYRIKKLPKKVTMEWDLFGDKIQQVPADATDEAGGMPTTLTRSEPVLLWQNFLTNPKIPAMVAIAPPPEPPRIHLPIVSLVIGLVAVVSSILMIRRFRNGRRISVMPIAFLLAVVLTSVWCIRYRASFAHPFDDHKQISTNDAIEIQKGLLHNIYRSFDHRDASLIYDTLEISISGELLNEMYLQIRRGIELENQGGACVRVEEVKVEMAEIEFLPERVAFVSKCRWTVSGSVSHWGHTHRRTYQYSASFTIEAVKQQWKITAQELLDARRVTTQPTG